MDTQQRAQFIVLLRGRKTKEAEHEQLSGATFSVGQFRSELLSQFGACTFWYCV
jgi:hypothetical protein